MNIAYLSLGSSLDKERNLPAGVRLLAQHGRILAVSPVYETAPVGNAGDPTFFNAAVALETPLDAETLKANVLRAVEDQLGRQRSADRNAPRTFDADIVLFNQQILTVAGQRIPDPDILRHAYIAVPLADVAPDYRHPESGETLADIAARLRAAASLVRRDDVALEG